jgi:ADP-ribosylglycohydrolase
MKRTARKFSLITLINKRIALNRQTIGNSDKSLGTVPDAIFVFFYFQNRQSCLQKSKLETLGEGEREREREVKETESEK